MSLREGERRQGSCLRVSYSQGVKDLSLSEVFTGSFLGPLGRLRHLLEVVFVSGLIGPGGCGRLICLSLVGRARGPGLTLLRLKHIVYNKQCFIGK